MSPPPALQSPPGYGRIVPLDKKKHAGFGLRTGLTHAWTNKLNAVFLGAAEMPRASLDYPLAFVRDDSANEFVPVAILGLRQDHNVFVDAQGRWREHCYVPAYVRRYPFCLADIVSKDGHEAQHMICVQEDQLEAGRPPLFDAEGKPTAAWAPGRELIEALEGARQQTRALCRRLEALGLLAPFDAVAVPSTGERLRLAGLNRVDEGKLAQLPPKELDTLLKRGELRAIYSHLNSLENFARLMDMSQARNT